MQFSTLEQAFDAVTDAGVWIGNLSRVRHPHGVWTPGDWSCTLLSPPSKSKRDSSIYALGYGHTPTQAITSALLDLTKPAKVAKARLSTLSGDDLLSKLGLI